MTRPAITKKERLTTVSRSFFYKKLQAMPLIFLRSKVQREYLLP